MPRTLRDREWLQEAIRSVARGLIASTEDALRHEVLAICADEWPGIISSYEFKHLVETEMASCEVVVLLL